MAIFRFACFFIIFLFFPKPFIFKVGIRHFFLTAHYFSLCKSSIYFTSFSKKLSFVDFGLHNVRFFQHILVGLSKDF
jgi:hypothetical protein